MYLAPGAPRAHQLKALEVKRFMDEEFGFTAEDEWLSRHIYFFVTDARIVGCVCAARIETALRVVYRDHGRGGTNVSGTSGPGLSIPPFASGVAVQERQQPEQIQVGDTGSEMGKVGTNAPAYVTSEGTTSAGASASISASAPTDEATAGTELIDIAPTLSPSATTAATKSEATNTTKTPGTADATDSDAEGLNEASKSAARARGLVEISGLWCNPKPVRAVAGVCHIWVHKRHRRRNIATRLVDAMRSSIVYGHRVTRQECAFSAPTEAGARFASAYVGGARDAANNPGTDIATVPGNVDCETDVDCKARCPTDLLVF